MIRVVLDTNIVISAHLSPAGLESRVLRLVQAHHLHLTVSEPLLTEYEFVLLRPRFSLDRNYVQRFLKRLRAESTLVTPARQLVISAHAADNRFLECAEAGEADFLVTGNKRHFPAHWGKTRVVAATVSLSLPL
jgi:uncharacterized protein